jgi:extracellular elastinolytic metalloproteinase
VTDFVADATYTVLPPPKQDPTDGIEQVTNPEDETASPDGWSGNNDTEGNNVISYKDDESAITTGYDFTYDPDQAPEAGDNVDAARVQAFYLTNLVHDFAYRYGFTEETYNFQADNFNKGGEGNDPVLMSVQDASGTDNANFATPPE